MIREGKERGAIMIPSDYMNDVLNGEAMLDDVDAYVAFWHEHSMVQSLQEFLGFTDEEYDCWMKDGNHVSKHNPPKINGITFFHLTVSAFHKN